MRYMPKTVLLLQLSLFLIIAVHAHGAMAYEVEIRNNTPHGYIIEYTTWSTDAWDYHNRKFHFICQPNKTCETQSDPDPIDTGSMGIKLTGEFKIWELGPPQAILSAEEANSQRHPENTDAPYKFLCGEEKQSSATMTIDPDWIDPDAGEKITTGCGRIG